MFNVTPCYFFYLVIFICSIFLLCNWFLSWRLYSVLLFPLLLYLFHSSRSSFFDKVCCLTLHVEIFFLHICRFIFFLYYVFFHLASGMIFFTSCESKNAFLANFSLFSIFYYFSIYQQNFYYKNLKTKQSHKNHKTKFSY